MTSEERQKRLDPRQIRDVLRSLRGRVRLHVGLRGAALLVGTLALVALASLAIDRGFRLSVGARSVALFVYGFAMLWVSWRYLLRPLLVGLPDRLLADSLERHFPALGDTLRSAIDFLRTPGIFDRAAPRRLPEEQALTLLLKQEVTHQAASRLGSTETSEIVASGRSLASVAVWVLPAVLAVGLGLAFTEVSSLWFRRNLLLSDVEWPYRTILHVEGFTDRRLGVPRGDPLRVRVRVEGEEPDLVSIRLDFEGDRARYNLARTREGFEYRHSAVTEDFRFVVEGGDYRSKPYEVFVQERPRVEAITVTLTPPAYTGRGPIRGEGGLGEMAAPQGSRLSLEGHANKDLESASLWTENRQVPLEVSADRRQFSGAYLPETGGGVTVHLEDVEGIDPDQRLQFSLHLIPDRTPAVQLKVSGLGPMITPVALMPLEIHAKDDYRVDGLTVRWNLIDENGKEVGKGERNLEDPEPPGDNLRLLRDWQILPLEIVPEKRLNVQVGATDNDGLTAPKTGYSGTVSFLVVTTERLIEEFVRREEEQGRVLDRLIDKEKNVRDAVYRLLTESWTVEGKLPEKVVQEMRSLTRVERQDARQLEAVAAAVEQILTEMKNNGIGAVDDLARLASLIITPLRELSVTSMPRAAAELGVIRDTLESRERVEQGITLADRLVEQLAILEEIKDNMLRLEGFTEIVQHLRVIIRTVDESRTAAEKKLDEEIGQIFEPESEGALEGQPERPRKPGGD